jgi:uncharacterized protein YcbK (DUF882 family)
MRRAVARRPREPLRILIAGDPKRPVRAIVVPSSVPRVAIAIVAVLLVVAAGATLTSLWLGRSVGRLEGKVAEMVHAAESVAQHPLGHAAAVGSGAEARLGLHKPVGSSGRFTLESVNTGERIEVVIDLATGEPDVQSYRGLRKVMRCLRTGAETQIDPRLIELLYQIAQRTRRTIQLVSGFRAPMFSTADLSYHTRGMAADIRIPGMTPLMVRDLVLSMGVKGVGYYPVSQFVHVDVREQRSYWIDYGSKRDDGEGAEHGPGR